MMVLNSRRSEQGTQNLIWYVEPEKELVHTPDSEIGTFLCGHFLCAVSLAFGTQPAVVVVRIYETSSQAHLLLPDQISVSHVFHPPKVF